MESASPDRSPRSSRMLRGCTASPRGPQPPQPVCPAAVLARVGACAAGAGRVDLLGLALLDPGTVSVFGRGWLVGCALPAGVQGGICRGRCHGGFSFEALRGGGVLGGGAVGGGAGGGHVALSP